MQVRLCNSFHIRAALVALLAWGNPLLPQQTAQESREKPPAMAIVIFRGEAHGGGLKLWIKGKVLSISTSPHENTAQIAASASNMINADPEMKSQGITAEVEGRKLRIHVNEVWVYLCAEDKGLKVPPPPEDLRLEKSPDGITHLSWKIPHSGYDRINILRGMVPIADGIEGSSTSFSEFSLGEKMSYTVFGIKDGTPSCAATY
jgi:hypothetical protein